MSLKLLLFALGVIALGYSPHLPSLLWLLLLLPMLVCAWLVPRCWYLFAFMAGLGWGTWAGHGFVQQQLPEALVGQDLWLTGQVRGLPEPEPRRLRFYLRVESISNVQGEAIALESMPETVQLSWYAPRAGYGSNSVDAAPAAEGLPDLSIGQAWRLKVRLKRPRGFVNPAGFDYQAWLLRRGIGATGYVLAHKLNQPVALANPPWHWDDWIHQRRQNLQQWVLSQSQSSEKGILVALLIGDTAQVEKAQWQRMQQTGTSHLIAISGLHVGFLALFGFYVGLLLGKCVQLFWHRCPALMIAWVSAIACAGYYAALAGFNIPTVRTLIMLSLFYISCLARRGLAIRHIFCWALALVMLLDPLAAYDMGFWLSFGAVALLLIYFAGRLAPKTANQPWVGFSPGELVLGFVRSQWVMFIGLVVPLTLLVSTVSLVAPIANALAIPLITFLVVPLLLLGAGLSELWPWLSQLLLAGAGWAMECLAVFLNALLHWAGPWASPVVAFSGYLLPLLLISLSVLLLPRGLFPRALGFAGVCLVALLSWGVKLPQRDDLVLTFLEVGQGSAIVVQVGAHTLVYDTGPRYTDSFDAGSAIVAPYLHAQGIRAIDYLVVSHWDLDHAGGVDGLLGKLEVQHYLAGEPERQGRKSPLRQHSHIGFESCHEHQAWYWQSVQFEFLTVPEGVRNNANNHSCVLLIRYGDQQLLLPGDIETKVERALLETGQVPESLTVLAAAHHGSRSSSGAPWVAHTRPEFVVYSAGYRNQHRHPHPQVQQRFASLGSRSFITAETGAVVFRWREQALHSVRQYRHYARRYWYDN